MSRNGFLLGLALIVAMFWGVASSRYSADWFGSPHDDTLYFSSAKSIAEGKGYLMPSLPGEPPQTKYPALYPALLSLAWRAEPAFPQNLAWAWRVNMLLAAAGLLAAAALARQLGAGRLETLAVTAATGLQPLWVYWSNHFVSDVLFAPLALTAAVLAQREIKKMEASRELRWARWASVAALLALACMTRTVGVAFVAGVAAACLLRKLWVPSAIALSGAAPVAYGLFGAGRAAAAPTEAALLDGFRQNWIYYTNYIEHWKECVPSLDILAAQASLALTEALKHPAVAVFQIPATGFVSFPVAVLAIALTVGIVAGIVGRARAQGLHPIHLAALFYLPIVLLWNYLLMGRFWLPFTVLFFAGASHELIRIARMTTANWRKGPVGDRVVIAGFASAVSLLVVFAAYQGLIRTPRGLARAEEARARLAEPKREAYDWLSAKAAVSAPVISYDDVALYLFTGRQGMRAFSPLTDSFFAQSESLLERDLDGITDTAATLHARYWVVSPDDFEMTHAPEEIRERLAAELAEAPVVFTSADGKVKIHDIAKMPWARADPPGLGAGGRGREP